MKRLKMFAVIASVFLVFGFGMTGCDNGTTGGEGGGGGAGMTVTITGIPAGEERNWSIRFGTASNVRSTSDRVTVPASGGNATFTMMGVGSPGGFNTAGTYTVTITNWVGTTGRAIASASGRELNAGANTIGWSSFQ